MEGVLLERRLRQERATGEQEGAIRGPAKEYCLRIQGGAQFYSPGFGNSSPSALDSPQPKI
jgi:hypothetical protein